jgi:uncharacterized protein
LSVPSFAAPWWLPGGNLQTIWGAKMARRSDGFLAEPQWRRERWTTPDGDFVDADFSTHAVAANAKVLVLFHGLEGSSASHYSEAFAHVCAALGLQLVIPHFRGCSGELNAGPRAYHSGDHAEIDWMLKRVAATFGQAHRVAVGVSLGGNALMRWAGEHGQAAAATVSAVCSISSPLDLAASGHAIGRGFNRLVYTRMFLATMKPKALRKLAQHPGLFDRERMLASTDLYEFDNVFTAPLHGFTNTEDYWARASAKPVLRHIRIPALCLNAVNDPFMPASSLPKAADVGSHVQLWQPAHGGHVGFVQGGFPGQVHGLPEAVVPWLLNA